MYFEKVAKEWDSNSRKERAKILASTILDKLGDTKDLIALEIGCGTGLLTFELNEYFFKIYCADTSIEMLSVLEDKINNTNTKNIYAFSEDLLDNKEYYQTFDVIYSSMVFHHINDIRKELQLLHNLLKKDGIFIIIDLDKEDGRFHKLEEDFCGHNGFDRNELQLIIEESKFNDVSFKTVYTGEKEIEDDIIPYSLFLCSAKGVCLKH